MSASRPEVAVQPSREAVAEAAAWIARLHGPRRSPQVEAGFREWLAADEQNARAFQGMSEIWDAVPGVEMGGMPRVAGRRARVGMPVWARAAAAVMVCIMLSFAAYWFADNEYATGIGEQRVVNLRDGTRVTLNAGTRMAVDYDDAQRRIDLREGEAIFEVAKRPRWPFIVEAGDREIRALGTTFVVRRDGRRLSVMLVEGKVAVSTVDAAGSFREESQDHARVRLATEGGSAPSQSGPVEARAQGSGGESFLLSAGQRLTLVGNNTAKMDTPRVHVVTAWRRGEVILDETSLVDAAAEMNRYDRSQIVIDDPRISALPVSGVYRTGDSAGFSQVVARMYGLGVTHEDGRIHLHDRADRTRH